MPADRLRRTTNSSMLSTNAPSGEPRPRTIKLWLRGSRDLRCLHACAGDCERWHAYREHQQLCQRMRDVHVQRPLPLHRPCSGTSPMGAVGGTPWPGTPTPAGGNYWAETVAPPGITITSASVTGANISNVNNNQGWGGGSFYAGGGSPWYNDQTSEYDGPFNSRYWGLSGCLRLVELQQPRQHLRGRHSTHCRRESGYRTNRHRREQPLVSDESRRIRVESARRSVVYRARGHRPLRGVQHVGQLGRSLYPGSFVGSGYVSVGAECPNCHWESVHGAGIDTRDYAPGAGALSLEFAATNAAGVTATAGPESLAVDNDPVGVPFCPPNDANPSVWVNHAVALVPRSSRRLLLPRSR
jgi:hypothetical protein